MSNKMRFRRGHRKVATGKIKAGTKVEIGDLIYQSPLDNYWYPAKSIVAAGTGPGFAAGTATANFKGAFVGVLEEGATAGTETKDSDALCGYDAEYEFDVSVPLAADKPAGTPVTAFVDGPTLANQKVLVASAMTDAIGTISRYGLTGKASVFVYLTSSTMQSPLS